jgi:hypothetical protein
MALKEATSSMGSRGNAAALQDYSHVAQKYEDVLTGLVETR